MAGYVYVAVDINGKEKRGKMEAPNEDRVFHLLKTDGLFPIDIREQNIFNRDINISFNAGIKARDYSVFSRQFVSILSAGVPIIKALEMTVEQTENKQLKKGLLESKILVEKGEKLADAMRNQGKTFPPILINMVEAGEASGSLEIALERMALHFEKDAKIKSLMKKAMIYPVAVGFVSLAVVILMLIVVIPAFMKMFEDMDMKMPAITLTAKAMSDFLLQKWYIVLGIIILIMIIVSAIKNSTQGKVFFAKVSLKLPLFGKLIIKSACSRFARTLSTLIAAGIPLIDAIDITARTMDNLIIKKLLYDAKEEVARGVPLSVPLEASGIFPPMVYHMTKIGEETGNMEEMLTKIADYYDEEVEITSQSLTAAMEPLIIVVLALVVGLLIMAIMQPMFAMYDQLDTLAQ
ncbi:MAG: type II secretion system F family protein [Herbinix sp.]|nr:type II secretion system F family protein [Herbinix sp.]